MLISVTQVKYPPVSDLTSITNPAIFSFSNTFPGSFDYSLAKEIEEIYEKCGFICHCKDFGNSYYLDETGKRNILLGTPGYAAPEQYRYEGLDERTDIYGIGAVLYFMVTGRSSSHISAGSLEFPNEISGKYKMIVRQCISEDMSNRFSRVYMIADNLSDLTNQDIKYSDGNKPLTISLVGTKANCGVTSIGLALASKLAKDEKRVIFEE